MKKVNKIKALAAVIALSIAVAVPVVLAQTGGEGQKSERRMHRGVDRLAAAAACVRAAQHIDDDADPGDGTPDPGIQLHGETYAFRERRVSAAGPATITVSAHRTVSD